MNRIKAMILVIIATVVLAGCGVTPPPVTSLKSNFFSAQSIAKTRVGVHLIVARADTHLVGAGCLLCIAAASAANSSLTKHIRTLSADDLKDIDDKIVAELVEKGMQIKLIERMPSFENLAKFSNDHNYAKKDYRVFKEQFDIDKLIVIDITRVGAYRTYANYFPTSDPQGSVAGSIYMIDLETNRYEMYKPIDNNITTDGEWDEPPTFPGVTNTYYQAIEKTKAQILSYFDKSAALQTQQVAK